MTLPITTLLKKLAKTGTPTVTIIERVEALERDLAEKSADARRALARVEARRKWDADRAKRRRDDARERRESTGLQSPESTRQNAPSPPDSQNGVHPTPVHPTPSKMLNKSNALAKSSTRLQNPGSVIVITKKDSIEEESKNQTLRQDAPPQSSPVDGELFGTCATGSDWPRDYREQFWTMCPRRVEKKSAMAKLDAIRKGGEVRWGVFWAGVLRWAKQSAGKELRYIKHPTTWLNRGCWDDETPPPDGGLPVGGIAKGSAFIDIAMGGKLQ